MKNKKQKIWEYMRRNKLFRVGDMMIVFDLKKSYATGYFGSLKKRDCYNKFLAEKSL